MAAPACSGDRGGFALVGSPDGRVTAVGTGLARFPPDGGHLDPSFAGGRVAPLGLSAEALAATPDGGLVFAVLDPLACPPHGNGPADAKRAGLLARCGVDGVVSTRFPIEAAAADGAAGTSSTWSASAGRACGGCSATRFPPRVDVRRGDGRATPSWSRDGRRIALDARASRFPAASGSVEPRPGVHVVDVRTPRLRSIGAGTG